MNILIIDDDEVTTKSVTKRLERKDYKVFYLKEAKDVALYIKEKKIDLVLLDFVMPGKSGLEVLVEIRKVYSEFQLPVIMVTSINEIVSIVSCFDKGANDYIVKPINITIACSRINTHLKIKNLTESKLKSTEMETVQKLIGTYSHEINNPLTIAVGNLPGKAEDLTDEKLEKINEALARIVKIVKELKTLNIVEEVYSEGTKIYKISS